MSSVCACHDLPHPGTHSSISARSKIEIRTKRDRSRSAWALSIFHAVSLISVSTDYQAFQQFFQVVSGIFYAVSPCFSSLDSCLKCSSQCLILFLWALIIMSTCLPIEDIVMSMVSIGTLYRAFRILATNSSWLSFIIFFEKPS